MDDLEMIFGERVMGMAKSFGRIGIDGEPIKRPKETNPYSYDPYILWGEPQKKGIEVVYSDRIESNKLGWHDSRDPVKVQEMLNEEMKDWAKVELTMIAEGANMATGYQYWVYGFEIIEDRRVK